MRERFESIGAIITSILAAVCCFGTAVLAGLGIAGVVVLSSGFFERLRLFFLAMTGVFVAFSYRSAYGKRAGCMKDGRCDLRARRLNRILFWVVAVFAVFGIAFPYLL